MQKNYKNGIISGNTVRFGGYNKKTTRNFIIVNDEKIKLNKITNISSKNSSKKYKNYHDEE